MIDDDAFIEAIARKICDKLHPTYEDELVSGWYLLQKVQGTPLGEVFVKPPDHYWTPLWTLYVDVAKLAYEEAKKS